MKTTIEKILNHHEAVKVHIENLRSRKMSVLSTPEGSLSFLLPKSAYFPERNSSNLNFLPCLGNVFCKVWQQLLLQKTCLLFRESLAKKVIGNVFQSFAKVYIVYWIYSNLNEFFFFFRIVQNIYKNKNNQINHKWSI